MLVLLLSSACTKVHFVAPTATFDPGVEVTVKHAMAKRSHFHLVAIVTNWTNRPLFVNTSWWRLRLPDGFTIEPKKTKRQVLMLDHGRSEKVTMVFSLDNIDVDYLPGAELVVGGASDHPDRFRAPVGVVRLERRE
jgi:hypothetical protein